MPRPDPKELHEFCRNVCLGDEDAMRFCDMWMTYCHAIDDLIDTMEDGRPTMTPETILEIFALAAHLYNSKFFIANQPRLYPVAIMITNAYADSVLWEKSPVLRRRRIADVLRCCGNEMFFLVALLCGGWQHMRKLSPLIRERSWQLQHDEHDQPD